MDSACCPQHLLELWVWGCLAVGSILLLGGARAAGAALVGSSVSFCLRFPPEGALWGRPPRNPRARRGHRGERRTGRVRPRGARLRSRPPAGSIPRGAGFGDRHRRRREAYILQIQEAAAPSCSLMDARPVTNASSPFAASCFRGFEDQRLQALLWFNVGFLALLFLVAAWRDSRHRGRTNRTTAGWAGYWLLSLVAGRRSCEVPSPGLTPGPRRLCAILGATSILIAACTSTVTRPNPSTAVCFDAAKVRGLYEEWAHASTDIWIGDGVDLAQVAASLRTARETCWNSPGRRPPIRWRPGTSKTRRTPT